jgi:hypothetical protein
MLSPEWVKKYAFLVTGSTLFDRPPTRQAEGLRQAISGRSDQCRTEAVAHFVGVKGDAAQQLD